MSSGRLSCGERITKNTTLTADVGPCAGTGIIIGTDDITLNLNGHTVSGSPGPGDGNAAGIRLPFRSGVTITGHPGNSGKTGTVTGFDAGVLINGGSNNTVEKVIVRDNIGPLDSNSFLGDGIAILHSSANRIVNNLVAHNGIYDGIAMLGVDSDDNLIQGNVVGLANVGGVIKGIEIHGTEDQLVPYEGGLVRPEGVATQPAPPTLAVAEHWAAVNGCPAGPGEETDGLVTTLTWTDCPDGADVKLVAVEGGGHTWFASGLGPANGAVDATSLIWDFFSSGQGAA